MEQVTKVFGIIQQERHKNHLKIYKHKESKYHSKIFVKNLNHKWFNKWFGSHQCAQNTKTQVGNKKAKRKWYKTIQPLSKPKLHTLLAALKFLMPKNPILIIKKQEPHWCGTYYMHIIPQWRENTSKVGCCYRMKNEKINQIKQHSS